MPLFRRSQGAPAGRPVLRDSMCLYSGEPFPRAGERIAIADIGITFDVLLDREEIPERWTDLAAMIREHSGEPRERRVAVNILATMLAMVENKMDSLGQALGVEDAVGSTCAALRRGQDSIQPCRDALAGRPRGAEYFDFEVIKIASLLASTQSVQARTSAEWPAPDIWAGDVNAFTHPN